MNARSASKGGLEQAIDRSSAIPFHYDVKILLYTWHAGMQRSPQGLVKTARAGLALTQAIADYIITSLVSFEIGHALCWFPGRPPHPHLRQVAPEPGYADELTASSSRLSHPLLAPWSNEE